MSSSFFLTSFCITLIHPILLVSFLYCCFRRSFLHFLPSSCDYRFFYFPLHFFSSVTLYFLVRVLLSSSLSLNTSVSFTSFLHRLIVLIVVVVVVFPAAAYAAVAEEEEYLSTE